MAVKAVTGTELGYLRRDGQFSRFYLSIDQPTPVFQAVYNDVAQTDKVAHFAYTSPLGDLSDVLPGMTLAVGSGLGESDKGLARIRKAPSGATFYIGISSEIDFKPGDFLTVFDPDDQNTLPTDAASRALINGGWRSAVRRQRLAIGCW